MSRAVLLSVLLATLILVGATAPALASQLEYARINPNHETSPFKMKYQKTVFIEYPHGSNLFNELQGKEWTVSGTADSTDPGVMTLIRELNSNIANDGSQANIVDLNVTYDFRLMARDLNTSVDFNVILEGTLGNYVILNDPQKTIVDMAWRGISTDKEIIVDGVEINIPINILRDNEPSVHAYFVGTEAENVLGMHLINADFILEQPLTNWHFLFDPTGINVDAGTFGLDEEITGFVVSSWTMGESSIREGRQVERVFEATVTADQTYTVRSVQSADQANLSAVGFGALDMVDGIEIIGITALPPDGYTTTSTGDFPVFIIYGMAGIAALAGIAFFFISSRSLKNEKQGQQGIDPNRLIGYETSDSSGGYKTNRGEAQLRDDTDYQQTRNYYDEAGSAQKQDSTTAPPPSQPASLPEQDAACGCAASSEMGSECDCAMQGACLCDATCKCNAEICKEQANSMS